MRLKSFLVRIIMWSLWPYDCCIFNFLRSSEDGKHAFSERNLRFQINLGLWGVDLHQLLLWSHPHQWHVSDFPCCENTFTHKHGISSVNLSDWQKRTRQIVRNRTLTALCQSVVCKSFKTYSKLNIFYNVTSSRHHPRLSLVQSRPVTLYVVFNPS